MMQRVHTTRWMTLVWAAGLCGCAVEGTATVAVPATPTVLEGSVDGDLPDSPGTPPVVGDEDVPPPEGPPQNFSFTEPGLLAGLAKPGLRYDRSIEWDLTWLAEEADVSLLISLDENGQQADDLAVAGLRYLHLPIEDFHAPTADQVDAFVAAVAEAEAAGEVVAAHCYAGIGRTGTMLAAWKVAKYGMTADEAIDAVREIRPGSVETADQRAALEDLAARTPQ